MKKLMTLALFAMGFALTANAQEKKTTIEVPQWVKNIKFSGYGMLQYEVVAENVLHVAGKEQGVVDTVEP